MCDSLIYLLFRALSKSLWRTLLGVKIHGTLFLLSINMIIESIIVRSGTILFFASSYSFPFCRLILLLSFLL